MNIKAEYDETLSEIWDGSQILNSLPGWYTLN